MSWKSLFGVAALAACCSTAVFAQQAPAQAPAQAKAEVDEEEAFDEKLREFGYWSGAAFACVAPEKPIGQGPFYLIMRSYDPDPRIASGQWAPPPVTTAR